MTPTQSSKAKLERTQKMPYASMSDGELILLCQSRDQKAFEHLIKRYERTIYAWIFQITPDFVDRCDLAQESMIKVWCSIGTLRRCEAFRVWLRQLVTHVVYDNLRQMPRNPMISIDAPLLSEGEETDYAKEIADNSCVPDTLYERHELACAIRGAIAKLPDEFRIAMMLREMAGLPYSEIAQLTGTGPGTVKSRIFRGRDRVKNILEPYLKVA
jgi:RNA polymerase sigma-70 factor (ECF subfamily)